MNFCENLSCIKKVIDSTPQENMKQVVNLFLIREHCNRFGVPLLSGATAQKQEACVCVGGGGDLRPYLSQVKDSSFQ